MKVVGKKTVSEISETVAIGSVDTDFTQQAASLLEIAKQKGIIIELQNFRLQIVDHGTDET